MYLPTTAIIIYFTSLFIIKFVAANPMHGTTSSNSTYLDISARSVLKVREPFRQQTQCFQKGSTFRSTDLDDYATLLLSQHPDYVQYLPSRRYNNGVHSTAEVCVFNRDRRQNTYVKNAEVGRGLRSIYDECCRNKPECLGGHAYGYGEPHQDNQHQDLPIDIVGRNVGTGVCNP
ncbi:MAG: hypothetical protein Q9209_003084 [Squamulea sp. 1 TL-2023]